MPHDHPNFAAGCFIIRRVSRANHVVPDKNRGGSRVSSALYKFSHPTDHLSCDSEMCILQCGGDPATWPPSAHWDGAVIISVDDFRSVEDPKRPPYKIGMVPLVNNRCHGGVWGKITGGQANQLLSKSAWLVAIPGVHVC